MLHHVIFIFSYIFPWLSRCSTGNPRLSVVNPLVLGTPNPSNPPWITWLTQAPPMNRVGCLILPPAFWKALFVFLVNRRTQHESMEDLRWVRWLGDQVLQISEKCVFGMFLLNQLNQNKFSPHLHWKQRSQTLPKTSDTSDTSKFRASASFDSSTCSSWCRHGSPRLWRLPQNDPRLLGASKMARMCRVVICPWRPGTRNSNLKSWRYAKQNQSDELLPVSHSHNFIQFLHIKRVLKSGIPNKTRVVSVPIHGYPWHSMTTGWCKGLPPWQKSRINKPVLATMESIETPWSIYICIYIYILYTYHYYIIQHSTNHYRV